MSVSGIGQNYDYLGTATNYAQKKTPVREAISKTVEQPVNISISDKGKEYYHNSIRQNGQESYDTVLQQKEQLKNEKISFIDYGYEISKKAAQLGEDTTITGKSVLSTTDKANGYVKAYAELYDEIVQGYEKGTREIYVADENGTHKLTKEEELSALDTAYKKTVDDFVTREETNQHARKIIGEEAEKIAKISKRSSLATNFLNEQKARGTDKVSENLNYRFAKNLLPKLRKNCRLSSPSRKKKGLIKRRYICTLPALFLEVSWLSCIKEGGCSPLQSTSSQPNSDR